MQIIGIIVGYVIGILIGAIILRVATKWIIKKDIAFGDAFVTIFQVFLINTILGFIIGFMIYSQTNSTSEGVKWASLLMLPIGFPIQAAIISSRLVVPFSKACLVALAMGVVILGTSVVVGLIIFVMMQIAP